MWKLSRAFCLVVIAFSSAASSVISSRAFPSEVKKLRQLGYRSLREGNYHDASVSYGAIRQLLLHTRSAEGKAMCKLGGIVSAQCKLNLRQPFQAIAVLTSILDGSDKDTDILSTGSDIGEIHRRRGIALLNLGMTDFAAVDFKRARMLLKNNSRLEQLLLKVNRNSPELENKIQEQFLEFLREVQHQYSPPKLSDTPIHALYSDQPQLAKASIDRDISSALDSSFLVETLFGKSTKIMILLNIAKKLMKVYTFLSKYSDLLSSIVSGVLLAAALGLLKSLG
jgi:hypothetical protein